MRLFRGQLRKLIYRPATRLTPLFLGLLLVLVYVGVAAGSAQVTDPEGQAGIEGIVTFPVAYGLLATLLISLGGIAAATYAGMVRGGDWGWRTFGVVVARGESRSRYVLTEFAAISFLALLALVLLMAFGVLLATFAALALGYGIEGAGDPDTLADLASVVARGWYAITIQASFGLAAAAVTRSPLAGVVLIVALFFGEQLAPLIVPADIMAYAPLTAVTAIAGDASSIGAPASGGDLVEPLLVGSLYFVAALVIAVVAGRRAELD